jgi:uncharacterized protein YggE
MHDQPLIAVRGETVLKVLPEIARLEVSVVSRGADRVTALQILQERAALVAKILAGYPDAIATMDSSGLRVSPQLSNRRPPERLAGFVGTMRQSVAVTEFERVADLMSELAGQELTEVGGPWWELRPGSPVYRQARMAATLDAVSRARDYAEGLGCELAGLVELADARMLSSDAGTGEQTARFTAKLPQRSQVAAPEEYAFDLAPVQQTVRATVEARFRITPPDLSAIGPAAQAT